MSDESFPLAKLRTLQDCISLFAARDIPCRVSDCNEPYLQVLRLIVSARCGRGCHHPDGSAVWCHAEGITNRRQSPRGLDEMLMAACYLRERTGIDRVKIAGLEPRFDESFVPFIRGLRLAGFSRISITTHDEELLRHIEAYRDAGLTQLSVSIPHSEDSQFARIAYTGTATSLLGLVRRARELGLEPVKVNRVLQRGATGDLPRMLAFAQENKVTVKLFELMWTHHAGEHLARFHVPWTSFAHLWLHDVREVTLHEYPRSHRIRVCFSLRGGGGVEANVMDDKRHAEARVCHDCRHSAVCAEGYLGCGVRILPDLSVLPCLLRPELALDIARCTSSRNARLDTELDELIAGRATLQRVADATRHVLPLRLKEETA